MKVGYVIKDKTIEEGFIALDTSSGGYPNLITLKNATIWENIEKAKKKYKI